MVRLLLVLLLEPSLEVLFQEEEEEERRTFEQVEVDLLRTLSVLLLLPGTFHLPLVVLLPLLV